MSVQPSVAEYFHSRKRPADDCKKIKHPSKVFVLDNSLEKNSLVSTGNKTRGFSHPEVSNTVKRIVYPKAKVQDFNSKVANLSASKTKETSCNITKEISSNGYQMDVWKKFQKSKDSGMVCELPSTERTLIKKDNHELAIGGKSENVVKFHMKGPLSPAKKKIEENKSEQCNNMKHSTNPTIDASRKELNLKPILSRSSRLEEIKKKVKMFNENREKLEMKLERNTPAENITLEVYSSPLKTPTKIGNLGSPQGKMSPRELFKTPPRTSTPPRSPFKSPVFKRYEALVTEGRPALVLPYKYKSLAELFRCVDTVVSMMHNRKEAITLSKLRPGVQEMSSKNFTEYHLAQIKTVFPDAFKFTVVKKKSIGGSEKYELSIEPQLSDIKEGENYIMGPSVLLGRRRVFYNALLELVRDCHEEFLTKLSPPMSISRALLTRWHPDFPVDDVPDVPAAPLPQPPTADKITSAKEVLEKARNLFVVNPRMQRALQKLIKNKANDGKPSEYTTPAIIQNAAPLKAALTGVPTSLLERVRAKQAARAIEAMTRTPAQAEEAVRFTRLPEIARIVRNLFVTEKKSVLLREQVLSKLADSFRENLSLSSLDDHLKLLAEQTPGWITCCNLRKTDYVKLARDADMKRIMTRLESLAVDKCI